MHKIVMCLFICCSYVSASQPIKDEINLADVVVVHVNPKQDDCKKEDRPRTPSTPVKLATIRSRTKLYVAVIAAFTTTVGATVALTLGLTKCDK